MELVTFCKQAHEEIDKIMKHDDGFHQLEDMDFLTLMAKHYFCTNLAMEKTWKDYREITSGNEPAETKAVRNSLTEAEAISWVENMENSDGTSGPHWNIEQTTGAANQHNVNFEHIKPYHWWVAMNMIYSDYLHSLEMYHQAAGLPTPTVQQVVVYCVLMAKAFLFDEDSVEPCKKLKYYYNDIVKK